jgi:hypothetical protein
VFKRALLSQCGLVAGAFLFGKSLYIPDLDPQSRSATGGSSGIVANFAAAEIGGDVPDHVI